MLKSGNAYSDFSRVHAFCLSSNSVKERINRIFQFEGRLPDFVGGGDAEGGYAFKQALGGKDGDASAYSAAMAAFKAAKMMNKNHGEGYSNVYSVAFPVIAISSPLFEATLLEDGKLRVDEVSISEFIFHTHIPKFATSKIQVVRENQLEEFAKRAKKRSEEIIGAIIRKNIDGY